MKQKFKKLEEVSALVGKRAITVVDFNVPIKGNSVLDDYRIARSRKTLDFLSKKGAKTILVSHRSEENESLFPVYEHIKNIFPVSFAKTIEQARETIGQIKDGEFILLENIRMIGGASEVKNDSVFAKELSSCADIFVNEAFSVSHREHASIVGVPKFLPSYAGFLFAEEIENLSRAFSPVSPSLAVIGGAKFETKFPLVEKFLKSFDSVFIGGALANDILKARGAEVKNSLVSSIKIPVQVAQNNKLIAPSDLVWKNERIIDAGEKTISELKTFVSRAKFILWNGPLGEYDGGGYGVATERLARIISESSANTIVGGGDTLAVISKLGIRDKFSFVSTGGGAMLQFLANGTLPGIEALSK